MTPVGDASRDRLRWIDVTRGFAVFLVVFYHVVIALAVTSTQAPVWASTANNALSPFRIPVLIFCSGMLLPRSLAKPAGQYVMGKLRHIAWPYVVWTTAVVVLLVGGSQVAGDGNYPPSRIWEIITAPGTYTWYLAHLFVYYLISLVLPARVRLFSIPVLLVASALIADGDGWTRFTFLLAFFFLGEAVTRFHPVWRRIVRRRWVEVIAALTVVATSIVASRAFLRYEPVTALGVIGVAILAEPVGEWVARGRMGDWIAAIGRSSIVYYTTHWIVVTVFVHVLDRLHVTNGSVLVVILMALGLAVPAVMQALRTRSRIVSALYVWPEPVRATERERRVAVGA